MRQCANDVAVVSADVCRLALQAEVMPILPRLARHCSTGVSLLETFASPKPIWPHPPSARRPFAQSDFSESDTRNEVIGIHAVELQVEQVKATTVECRKLIWMFTSPEA